MFLFLLTSILISKRTTDVNEVLSLPYDILSLKNVEIIIKLIFSCKKIHLLNAHSPTFKALLRT